MLLLILKIIAIRSSSPWLRWDQPLLAMKSLTARLRWAFMVLSIKEDVLHVPPFFIKLPARGANVS